MHSEGSTRQKLTQMGVLQGFHRVLVPNHDSCDNHLDVSGHMIGLVGRISQVTEPKSEGADRQKILERVLKITEPAFGAPEAR